MKTEETKRLNLDIWQKTWALSDYAKAAASHPEKVNAADTAKMNTMARVIACKVSALDYLMQGNPPPKVGESKDGGETKVITINQA